VPGAEPVLSELEGNVDATERGKAGDRDVRATSKRHKPGADFGSVWPRKFVSGIYPLLLSS
jgi:hypothetical protein